MEAKGKLLGKTNKPEPAHPVSSAMWNTKARFLEKREVSPDGSTELREEQAAPHRTAWNGDKMVFCVQPQQ